MVGKGRNELIIEEPKVTDIPAADTLTLGQWYWVKVEKGEDDAEWLGCVMEIGTNYVELHSPHSPHHGYNTARVHFNDFFKKLRFEPEAEAVINKNIAHYQALTQKLLEEVKTITARLGVSPRLSLPNTSNEESGALMVVSSQNNVKEYEAALILAQDKQLPELFKAIKEANEEMAKWMTAPSLPLMASVESMEGVIGKIKDRVFNVSLYAGLTEEVVQCCEGKPAGLTDKLHVMQRRLYMDEECLLAYRTGGMDFASIDEFDKWISTPENRDRILPFPRCLVAMRVRRNDKDRESDGSLLSAFIHFRLKALDKLTFLYIRNGEQVYRLNCDLEFSEMIFPDRSVFGSGAGEEMMIRMFGGSIDRMITKAEYDELVRKREETKKKYHQWKRDNPQKEWCKKNEGSWEFANPYRDYEFDSGLHYDWHPFDPSSVYYDDAAKEIADEMKKYNRIALIIQGLFDRGPIFHPHPPVQTWTPEGFAAAVKLVYDGDSAVLYGGEKPDFDAYRQECNEKIDGNSVLVGQELFWLMREAEKENERIARDWRSTNKYCHETFQPHGNPGPGYLAKMRKWKRRSKQAVFRWERERIGYRRYDRRENEAILCTLMVPVSELFNVSAYRVGDYKQFFQDPRTRAEYLKWAPMLIAAEEYFAGNMQAKEPV